MSDDRVRILERRFRASGSVEDEAAWLRARGQIGELNEEQLRLAAFVDHQPARLALGDQAPTAPWDIRGWIDGLKAWGIDANYWPKEPSYYPETNQVTVWVPSDCPTSSPRLGMGALATTPVRQVEPAQRLLLLEDVADGSALRPRANAELAEWALLDSCPLGAHDHAHLATGKPVYLAHVVAGVESAGLNCRILPSDMYGGWDVPVWEEGSRIGGFTICRNGSYVVSPLRDSPRLAEIREAITARLGPEGFEIAEQHGQL